MYHDIVLSEKSISGFQNESAFMYKVSADKFEEQVKSLSGKNVVFTFDDGGSTFHTEAAPILERYGKKGIFFISTKYIGAPGFMTKEQIKDLDDRGHIIGSHSHSHPVDISQLKRDQIKEEWANSISILSEILGKKVTIGSIPNGYDSNEVVEAALAAGIIELHTSKPTNNIKIYKGVKMVGRYVVHRDTASQYVISIICNRITRGKLYVKWMVFKMVKLLLGRSYDKIKSLIVNK